MKGRYARASRQGNYLPPHPSDARGLPLIPRSISLECDPENCHYEIPHQDRHHVFHPINQYKTPLESEFRSLGCFVILMCRCQHEEWDRGIKEPEKPSPELMYQVIREYAQGEYELLSESEKPTIQTHEQEM